MRRIRWSRIAAPAQLVHVGARELAARDRVDRHGHDFAEVFWIRKGEGVHQLNGERHLLRENDLVTVLPGDVHGIGARGAERLGLLNVAFDCETLRFVAKRYFAGAEGFWRSRGPVHLAAAQRQWLDGAARRLASQTSSRLELDRFLLTLLCEIGRVRTDDRLANCPAWLKAACDQFAGGGDFAGGVREIARLARRSPEHVARTLKRATGMTPMQVVTDARMAHAATQLRLSGRAIIEIAMDCGYNSLSHFYAVFARAFGVSPRRYRLAHQSSMPSER